MLRDESTRLEKMKMKSAGGRQAGRQAGRGREERRQTDTCLLACTAGLIDKSPGTDLSTKQQQQ